MGKILVFTELERMVLDPAQKDLVLFGERDFLNDGKSKYDLIFYGKNVPNYSVVSPVTSLTIPVIRIPSNISSTLAYINYQYPGTTRVAVPAEWAIDFFDIFKLQQGRSVTHLGKYSKTPEKRFWEHVNDLSLQRAVTEIRRRIDHNY